ncbi:MULTISPECIES: DUF3592 domain-containing protein [unclassified Leptolyngbya]|uniref:DUF3592 domain-containing protein n=1 Tax=unclassified Leptolyngbya TaxID=2650499 RepID=UPI0016867142|nr:MULTISPECIES: DUF3592 domain-containing protein [unclassified Leptolyngbya]MBD1911762.1 DUF3592 domain-containing protein [Leptolyngbya sp. FACHB-8]MBD2152924.1 DUF3592 domain-containing protein [Leptolyngbya sp. FACHB-16]
MPNLEMVFIRFVFVMLGPTLLAGSFGLGLWIMAAYILRKSQQAQHWPETMGRVLSADVKEVIIKRQKHYQTVVCYEYFVQGQPYQSQRLSFGNACRISDRPTAQQAIRPFRPTMPVKVYYNPRKPQEAVLKRESDRTLLWALVGFGGVFLGMSLLIGTVVLSSALETCGLSPDSTAPRPGSPRWCYINSGLVPK